MTSCFRSCFNRSDKLQLIRGPLCNLLLIPRRDVFMAAHTTDRRHLLYWHYSNTQFVFFSAFDEDEDSTLLALFIKHSYAKTVIDIWALLYDFRWLFFTPTPKENFQLSGDMIDGKENCERGDCDVNHVTSTAMLFYCCFRFQPRLGRNIMKKNEGKKIHFVCVNIEHENG